MIRHIATRLSLLVCCSSMFCHAQLTTDQKMADFKQLVALYQRNYAPAAWKKEVFGFDLFDTAPWFHRVAQSTDDLGFYEICVEYVASLNDTHSAYLVPGSWSATLPFTVDVYGSEVLIDGIDRGKLPAAQFPFQIGDQLVSVDNVSVEDWIQRLSKWTASSNARSKRSAAAQRIIARRQSNFPRAPLETGDSAVVEIRRQSGATETYTIPWEKSGIPVIHVGRVRDPRGDGAEADLFSRSAFVRGISSLEPAFVMPPGFKQRTGNTGDYFYSGTFPSAGLSIGYLRIPVFVPSQGGAMGIVNPAAAIAQLASEIAFMQTNTDGLVIDIMHNIGGDGTYMNDIYSHISPQPWQLLRAAYRPNLSFLAQVERQLMQARSTNADPAETAYLEDMLREGQAAYARGDALTKPFFPTGKAFGDPARDSEGSVIAYSKPIMLLTDDFTVSAADAFAAQFQDNQRGIIFGVRTNGAGGNSASGNAGPYSQGSSGIEVNLNIRNHTINAPGYPATAYFDSVGVQPDIPADFMTKENLLNQGAPFSQAMVAAVTQYIRQHNQK